MLLQLPHIFLPFIPLCPAPLLPLAFPHLSSCPWVIHISSLASPFPNPIYFGPPVYASIPCTFPPTPLSPSLLMILHMISISVIPFLF